MKKKVLLGMSGGVDSSVSAILLQQQGYEVIGCTMLLHLEADQAIKDAKEVCNKLGITHIVCNYKEEFKTCVINKFIAEYQDGKTPNPCVECNKYLKFGAFYKKAKELNCDFIATGHYAKIEFSKKYNQLVLRKSNAENKDQTYFLYQIPKERLDHIIFPLADYNNKDEIKKIARENKLKVEEKKESQEICFIPDNNYQNFLRANMQEKPKSGNIVLKTGEILKQHNGLINYTIGQRKGLGISYSKPLYVIELNKEKNEVIVGEEKDLYSDTLYAKDLHWIVFDETPEKIECLAKIRYRAKEAPAIVYKKENEAVVKFETPQRAITKGQSVVFYDLDGIVLGGGKIR